MDVHSDQTTNLLPKPVSNGIDTSIKNEFTKLTKLNSTIYFLPGSNQRATESPSAIILCGWMGAPLRHLSKFVDYYAQVMFPGTPIILILTHNNKFFAADSERHKDMQPAVTAYQSLGIDSSNVLVHVLSNGGVNALKTFVSLLPSNSFTPKVLVVDSAPGVGSMSSAVNAFTADIKSPAKRFFFSIFVVFWFIVLVAQDVVMRREPKLVGLKRWLEDENEVGKKTKRVYMYSDIDHLSQKDSVEGHVDELRRKGFLYTSTNFGNSRHVGHLRSNPELYWSQILGAWTE
jgi:Eukaryotic protein of unknown function (DUF829)